MHKARQQTFIIYGAALLLCFLLMVYVLDLRHASLKVPFCYYWDGIFIATTIKGMLENGWSLFNPSIGMPTGAYFYELPLLDTFHWLIMKGLGYLVPNYAVVMNLYFLLTFPLITLSSLYVLRYLKIHPAPAIMASLLFAFLPFHMLRGEMHYNFSTYQLVPLVLLAILWNLERPLFFHYDEAAAKWRWTLGRREIVSLLVCLAISTSGYNAYFSCFFLLLGGIYGWYVKQEKRMFAACILLVVIITSGFIANGSPALLYQHAYGKNPELYHRNPGEAEVYGLKIAQLLLPVEGHRLKAFREVRASYDQHYPLNNENGMASLGLVGSVGFCGLIGMMLLGLSANRVAEKYRFWIFLNGAALLLAEIGGFGSLVTLLLTSLIRGYNRISLWIGFFSLTTVAFFLDFLYRRYALSFGKKTAFIACCLFLTGFGVWDQNKPFSSQTYAETQAIYANFVRQIEAEVPQNTMVFQLPYVAFPESPPVGAMQDYDHLRAYLESRHLRWSYGAIKGREADLWQKDVAKQPVPEFIAAIKAAGFGGVYINRSAYDDKGAKLESELSRYLQEKPLVSTDGRLAFYSLTAP